MLKWIKNIFTGKDKLVKSYKSFFVTRHHRPATDSKFIWALVGNIVAESPSGQADSRKLVQNTFLQMQNFAAFHRPGATDMKGLKWSGGTGNPRDLLLWSFPPHRLQIGDCRKFTIRISSMKCIPGRDGPILKTTKSWSRKWFTGYPSARITLETRNRTGRICFKGLHSRSHDCFTM